MSCGNIERAENIAVYFSNNALENPWKKLVSNSVSLGIKIICLIVEVLTTLPQNPLNVCYVFLFLIIT